MSSKLFVGNLSPETSEQDLMDVFNWFGRVRWVRIVKDRATQEPKGFAFVQMVRDLDALVALMKLNGEELDGRMIAVRAARTYKHSKGK